MSFSPLICAKLWEEKLLKKEESFCLFIHFRTCGKYHHISDICGGEELLTVDDWKKKTICWLQLLSLTNV